MSGTQQIPPIPLRFDGAENVQRTIDALIQRIQTLEAAGKNASDGVGRLETAAKAGVASVGALRTQAEQAGSAFRNTGQIIGQAGYQIQDFAVQVAGGQSALTAFAQQGSQLLGVFGPAGIIAGAVLAVGALAVRLFEARDGTTALANSQASLHGMLQRSIEFFETAAERAARLAQETRGAIAAQAILARSEARQGLLGAERALEALNADRARLIDANRNLPGFNPDAVLSGPIADQIREIGRFREEVRLAEEEYYRVLNPANLSGAQRDEARRSARGGGSRAADPELLAGWQAVQAQERDRRAEETRQTREWERDQERIEREAERARERAIQANRRVTDNIVNYTADAFADMFDENGKGWEGMLDTFESTFRRMLARIAAEAIIRPVVEPIVSGLGLGSLGTGNGGLSGLFGGSVSAGSGGSPHLGNQSRSPVLATGGGVTSLFGGGSNTGGMFRNIGGYVSNPIWQQGIGWFQPSQVAYNDMAGTLNSASAAAPWMFPGGFQTTGAGSSSILGSMGSVSAGTYVAAIGGGYTAGSMLGGYLAKTDAQRTNSQIGSAGGAAAGAMIGAAVGGPFAPVTAVIGGLIGGLAGGAGGGLLGPSSSFSGGDVGIGVGSDGYLRITGTGGKNWDSGQAQQAAQQQIDQLNAVLRASGVSIQGVQSGYTWKGGDTLGFMGSGGSSNVFGPTEIFNRVSSGLTTSNSTLAAALRSPWMQSFEDLSVIAPYAAQNDNLTRALGSSGIRSRDDFNSASQWITGIYEPMVKAAQVTNAWEDALAKQNATYDAAIARARELGLAESDLVAAREKSFAEAIRQRDTTVHQALESLRIDEQLAAGDTRGAAITRFNLESGSRLNDFQRFLTGNGIMEGSETYQSAISRLSALIETQRTTFLTDLNRNNEPDTSSGRSLMEWLTVGGGGGLSGAGQFAAGQKILADAKGSGNLDTYTAAARSVLTQARDYLGTSERYGALVADVSRTVRSMGGDPVGLSSMLMGQSATNDNLERIYGISNSQLSELKALRAEVSTLNATIAALIRRQTAA